jgi:curved DNA-binding protein CbpA
VSGVTDAPDPYKILQVDPEAEDEVIQAAYRRLAQKYHPDLSTGQAATDRMVAINAAWELIGDPKRRASYDRARRAARASVRETDPPSGAGGTGAESGREAAGERGPSTPAGSGPAAPGSAGPPPAGEPRPAQPPPPDTVSRDWTPGRSTTGGGYDATTMRMPEGLGAAGPPPGNAVGSVMNFGRYAGWSLGEIGRLDLGYLEWLDRMPIGRPYRDEIDVILRRSGRRKSAAAEATQRRGLFRRR